MKRQLGFLMSWAVLMVAFRVCAQTPAFIGKSFLVGGANGTPAVGDFNGDGKLDLALPNTAGAAVLLGNGDGTFQVAVQYAAGTQPLSIAVGDFNGDEKLDLALSDAASGAISNSDAAPYTRFCDRYSGHGGWRGLFSGHGNVERSCAYRRSDGYAGRQQ